MKPKKPWAKFYYRDWRAEPCLNMCSRGARSLWLDMCGLIHEAGDRGRLLIDGKAPTDRELAHALGDNPRTIRTLLAELQKAGVFDLENDPDGGPFVVNRRQFRDQLRAELAANYGRMGGNPALVNKDVAENRVKAQARGHMPETIALQAARDSVCKVLGPAVSPDLDLELLGIVLGEWLEKWDLDLDIVPVVKAKTAAHRKRLLRTLTPLADDIGKHHDRRVTGLPLSTPKPPRGAIAYPDGQAGEALRAVVAAKGEAWAGNWLKGAEWNGQAVYIRGEFSRDIVRNEAAHILAANGYPEVRLHPEGFGDDA